MIGTAVLHHITRDSKSRAVAYTPWADSVMSVVVKCKDHKKKMCRENLRVFLLGAFKEMISAGGSTYSSGPLL